jgi:hypothetical protein
MRLTEGLHLLRERLRLAQFLDGETVRFGIRGSVRAQFLIS